MKEHRAGGDDAVRPPFPLQASDLDPFGWPTFRIAQSLIELRRREPWLCSARTRCIHLTNQQIVVAVESEQRRVLIALNVGDNAVTVPVPTATLVAVGSSTLSEAICNDARISLPAHSWAVMLTGR